MNTTTQSAHNASPSFISAESLAKSLDSKAKLKGAEWNVRCPCHDDKNPSLYIKDGDNESPVFYCHYGCTQFDLITEFERRGLWGNRNNNTIDFRPSPGTRKTKKLERSERANWRNLQAVHDYRSSTNQPLFQVCRFQPSADGKKVFAQRRPDDTGGWIKGLGEIQPVLYRLSSVLKQASENGIIYICEGEKDVERLEQFGLVATCNAMGAGKWKDSYTASLVGASEVVILADNDEPGEKHAQTIANSLSKAKILHVIVRFDELAAKADVSDWLDLNSATKEQFLKYVESFRLNKQSEYQPEHFDNFTLYSDRVEVQFTDRNGNLTIDTLCSYMKVVAAARDPQNGEWARVVMVRDLDGMEHEIIVTASSLVGTAQECLKRLMDAGLVINPDRDRYIPRYILADRKDLKRARSVKRTGWFGNVFVLPKRVIGKSDEHIILDNHSESRGIERRGTIEDWKKLVGSKCRNNSRLMFTVCVAFAGPLVRLLGHEGGGFHFRGASSIGKSTALRVAASVYINPHNIPKWKATNNGIEVLGCLYNDLFLPLDEIGEIGAENAGAAAYTLAGGRGKQRANRFGDAKAASEWCVLYFSNGELSLEQYMNAAGKQSFAGQEVRMLGFQADAGAGLGIFEDTHGASSGAEFSRQLDQGARSSHGSVGEDFITRLTTFPREQLEELFNDTRQLFAKFVPEGADGQVLRAAERFILAATAGELATLWGLTDWGQSESIEASGKCFKAWLNERGGAQSHERKQALSQVQLFFQQHAGSRFTALNAAGDVGADGKTNNRAGYTRVATVDGETEFLVFQNVFSNEIAKGKDAKSTLAWCQDQGWLKSKGDGRKTQLVRLPGLKENSVVRMHVFSSAILGAESQDASEPSKDRS